MPFLFAHYAAVAVQPMSTDPRAQRWAQVSSWFDQLIDLSAAAQELALAELAERDAELAAEVRAMLIADARTQGVLEQREEVLAPVAAEANPEFGPSWRVQHLLGRGGMGEVWLAQRHQGDVVQTAAVKLLKRGMDSEALLQRFLQERRILAKLNHPAIASLLDAGVTPDGRPYLAMDYICGEPLTTFARAQGARAGGAAAPSGRSGAGGRLRASAVDRAPRSEAEQCAGRRRRASASARFRHRQGARR